MKKYVLLLLVMNGESYNEDDKNIIKNLLELNDYKGKIIEIQEKQVKFSIAIDRNKDNGLEDMITKNALIKRKFHITKYNADTLEELRNIKL